MSLIKNLFYTVADFKLDIPEWAFPDEGVTALTGASGSGKTSLLKILCGLISCPGLIWKVQGLNLANLPPPERKLGVCFQDLRLFPHLSAKQNILYPLQAKNIPFQEAQQNFEEMIELLELKKSLNLFIEDLSGGEKQRVALARALVVPPRFLFLDEPFSSLDEAQGQKALSLTAQIVKKYSVPTLLISHSRKDVESLADREFFLEKGKIHRRF